MIKFIKNFFESAIIYTNFTEENIVYIIITKFKYLIKNSLFMCNWDKMSREEKELWYLTENRVMEF